jgi:thiol-disulfide isomerase/thioredoxin
MMKKTWSLFFVLLLSIILEAQGRTQIKEGPWRFELKMTYATVPFIAEFRYQGKKLEGKIFNGDEVIVLSDLDYRHQHLTIPMQTYEVTLQLDQISSGHLQGHMVRHNKNPKVHTPLTAKFGERERFPGKKDSPTINLHGKWELELVDEKETVSQGLGNFVQKGSLLTGSILTPTGDHRYLDGYVSGDQFEAASFDGVYNYLFKGTVKDGQLQASLLSNSKVTVKGRQNDQARLPDAYKQTTIKKMDFNFPDLEGKMVSLKDARFKNRPVIVQIFGSWCPNCLDEMNFLIPWHKENQSRGVEIIALAFERSLSREDALRQLRKVQKVKEVPYPILLAASTAEEKPAEKLPTLTNFISFPTTIFLNKKHQVIKVHAGFSGPSTGEYFESWKQEFNQTVDELLK